ncbi:MAG: M50 family metallopeptidase [Proteobacteria bacterium]|nr:M50 family metallopeptidase [Pseudomonadota bacterium]
MATQDVPVKAERKHRIVACLAISALAIGLYFVPFGWYALYPFMLVYTFIHEMGHGIAAILTGGDFLKFEMWIDGSGMATSLPAEGAGRLSHAFVAFGGLIAPAIMAAICLALGRSGKASRIGLYVFTGICALSLILVVRPILFGFGFWFVLACGLASFALAKFPKSNRVPQYSMLFLAITLLTAVFSRGDYLFTPTAQTAIGVSPSDVGQIAENLFLPYWFWGGLIALLSVAILVIGVRSFFMADTDTPPQKQLPPE